MFCGHITYVCYNELMWLLASLLCFNILIQKLQLHTHKCILILVINDLLQSEQFICLSHNRLKELFGSFLLLLLFNLLVISHHFIFIFYSIGETFCTFEDPFYVIKHALATDTNLFKPSVLKMLEVLNMKFLMLSNFY